MAEDDEKKGPDAAIAAMRKERDAARREAREARAEVERLTPFEAQVQESAAQVEALTAELATATSGHSIELTLAEKGFDLAGRLAAKALHGALAPETEFSEWLDGLTGDSIPGPLRSYLEPAAQVEAPDDASADESESEATPEPAPRAGRAAVPDTPAASAITPRSIADARSQALKSGDWTQVEAMERAVLAEYQR